MDNATRSERSRNAVLQAALAVIARDGAGRLTLDAIARESGISKGGLMHQFRNKEAVLKALLELQIEHFADFSRRYMAEAGARRVQPELATEIATLREALTDPNSVFFAVLGAVAQDPGLMSAPRDLSAARIEAIKAEADDPELALIRWSAAMGLALASLLGLSPFSDGERERLFDRLVDDERWSALSKPGKPARARTARAAKGKVDDRGAG